MATTIAEINLLAYLHKSSQGKTALHHALNDLHGPPKLDTSFCVNRCAQVCIDMFTSHPLASNSELRHILKLFVSFYICTLRLLEIVFLGMYARNPQELLSTAHVWTWAVPRSS